MDNKFINSLSQCTKKEYNLIYVESYLFHYSWALLTLHERLHNNHEAPLPQNVALPEIPSTVTPALNVPTPTVETAVSTVETPHCSAGLQTNDLVEEIPIHTLRIVDQYPHDPNAFTQGFVFWDGKFIESTGLRGQSTVRFVEIESGLVEKVIANDAAEFGEGTAVFDNKLYQLTWKSGRGYVYDLDSFEQIGTFTYAGEGWGLTGNGRCLIMSNGSHLLTYRDPQTFEILGTLAIQDGNRFLSQLNELEYINDEIWANIWKSNLIARISPITGQVVGWIDATPLVNIVQPATNEAVLNGIAYDAENGRIFLTGKLWPTVFEVELIGNE